jgi:general secretion pathway protein C
MGIDAILKRYFPAVVCLLIAFAAYFQASGMGQLVAGAVAAPPSSGATAAVRAPRSVPMANLDHSTNAAAIISRNPFDSVTGPLDSEGVVIPNTQQVASTNNSPYADANCDVARVLLVAASEDPDWSFAAMAGSDGKVILRRKGDEVGGHTVTHIGRYSEWLASDDTIGPPYDRVWLTSGGSRCQIVVGGKAAVKGPAAPAPAATAEPSGGKRGAKKVPAEIAAKIHKVSDNEFNVERSVVDTILENQAELMRSARIVPEKEGDKVVGIRMFGIRPDSLLGTLGMQNGDRLQTINGIDMGSPEKALEAYSRLRTAERLTVTVNRGGKNQNIDFNIK